MPTTKSEEKNNPLFSLAGFDYIYGLLSGGPSAYELQSVFSSLNVQVFPQGDGNISFGANKKKEKIKDSQINGLLGVLGEIKPTTRFVEIGCGNGRLSFALARQGMTGESIDSNERLIENCRSRNSYSDNLKFLGADAFSYSPDFSPDLCLALHGCGNLSDRLVGIAVDKKADVAFVPCCYGLMKRSKPRSQTLRLREEEFNDAVSIAKSLEISPSNTHGEKYMRREAYRLLANFDRILYLTENGYSVRADSFIDETSKGSTRKTHSLVISGKKGRLLNYSV